MYAYRNIFWAVTRKRNNGQNDNGGACSQPTVHKKDLKNIYIYTDHGIVFYTMQFPTMIQNSKYLHRTYRTLTVKYT